MAVSVTPQDIRWLADRMIDWQHTSGGIDPSRCTFHAHTPLGKPSAYGQDIPWIARALYRMYEATGDERYKASADRYCTYFIAAIYETAPTFAMGDAIDPCFGEYRRHNPHDDSLDDKARTIQRWILTRRNDEGSAFDVGYAWRDDHGETRTGSDAAFSNDLADVGRALTFMAEYFDDSDARSEATRLGRFFVTDHVPGGLEGVWGAEIGTWLIGPHPAKGFENVDEYSDAVGWGWTNYYATHYLLRLREQIDDEAMKRRIDECCVSALRWTLDACQWPDGALGMSRRDDKWMGMTALAISQFHEVSAAGCLDDDSRETYGPRAAHAYEWLAARSQPDTFPQDGFVSITGATKPEPAWNTSWMMALVLEGVLLGATVRPWSEQMWG